MKEAVVDRWIGALREEFAGFERFGGGTSDFDAVEREYKLGTAQRLRAGLDAASDDLGRLEAVREAFGGYNLLNWRVLAALGDEWPKEEVAAALTALVEEGPDAVPANVGRFVRAWEAHAPKAQRDFARQIASAVAMHLFPERAIYFRRRVLDRLHREAKGVPFPRSDDPGEEYAAELAFAEEVRAAFEARGLTPRDMIDVQSALWRIHGHRGADDEAEPEASEDRRGVSPPALNTILYGPPGTGKTHATRARAVAICDGRDPEEVAANPDALRARYDELVDLKRIEFVTFHQSYGYEEFVEGLRPDPGGEDEDGAPIGLRLRAVDGALKRIAERARTRPASAPSAFDPEGRKVFKVSLGRSWDNEDAYIRDECLDEGCFLLGYGGDIDWSGREFDGGEAIAERWRREVGKPDLHGQNPNIAAIRQIRVAMREGDVVLASRGNLKVQAVGLVVGPYEFRERGEDEYHHRRRIEWRWKDETGEGTDASHLTTKRLTQWSIYQMDPRHILWENLRPYLGTTPDAAPPPPHVLIVDEINRANVSKVLGEAITLLEEDKRLGAPNELRVTLPHSGTAFGLPANLHILGTMNTADRSIALLDTALRRRFRFEHLAPRPDLLGAVEEDGHVVDLAALLRAINGRLEYLLGPDHRIGHAWLMGVGDGVALNEAMAFKIVPLLREYFHEDLERVRAVLGGGDGFLRRETLDPPPGLEELGEERHRHVDRYFEDDPGYAWEAYHEAIHGAAAARASGA